MVSLNDDGDLTIVYRAAKDSMKTKDVFLTEAEEKMVCTENGFAWLQNSYLSYVS